VSPGASELHTKVQTVKNGLVAIAEGRKDACPDYWHLRMELIQNPTVRDLVPECMRTCTTTAEFWSFIKSKFPTYQERRNYLREQFVPLITYLEQTTSAPADRGHSLVLSKVDSAHVHEAWRKALDRRAEDPDGAITAARTLLESVCKHILDKLGEAYDDKADLPKLYCQTTSKLNLSPSQHTEPIFKQILGGCHAVVEGLGALRNRHGDAHGKGKAGVKPLSRHAELGVNLAGAMATFLVATWEARISQ
jgi:hypothetical protein